MSLDVHGRQRDSLLGESAEGRPKPLPRQMRLQDDDDVKPPVPAARTSPRKTPTSDQRVTPIERRRVRSGDREQFADDDDDHSRQSRRSPLDRHDFMPDRKMPPTRKTPTSDIRVTPTNWCQSPSNDRELLTDWHKIDDDRSNRDTDSRRSPLDRHDFTDRKSPLSDIFHKSPLDRHEIEESKESFRRYDASKRTPSDRPSSTDRKSPVADRQPSGATSQKSPFENGMLFNPQKLPADDRKTPIADRRKTSVNFQYKNENSPSTQRKGSVVDFLTESADVKETENSDGVKKYRTRRKSGSPQPHGQMSRSPSLKRSESTEKNPFDDVCKSPVAAARTSKQNSLDGKSHRHNKQVIFCCCCVFYRVCIYV